MDPSKLSIKLSSKDGKLTVTLWYDGSPISEDSIGRSALKGILEGRFVNYPAEHCHDPYEERDAEGYTADERFYDWKGSGNR